MDQSNGESTKVSSEGQSHNYYSNPRFFYFNTLSTSNSLISYLLRLPLCQKWMKVLSNYYSDTDHDRGHLTSLTLKT
jgi:hypothetical protein